MSSPSRNNRPNNAQQPRLTLRSILIGCGAVIVVGILVVAALTRHADNAGDATDDRVNPSPTPAATSVAASQAQVPDLARRRPNDPLALGRFDAPVVMVEYSDFRCPYCGVFARDTKPKLMRFVKDGTLRIEFRDMPIFGAQSTAAAVAGRAAAAQGKFWEFYDAVYAESPKRGHADLPTSALVRLGRKAGVPDMDAYTQAIKKQKDLTSINADLAEGYQLGVTATPAFLINSTPILGAQPTDVFIETVEKEAAK